MQHSHFPPSLHFFFRSSRNVAGVPSPKSPKHPSWRVEVAAALRRARGKRASRETWRCRSGSTRAQLQGCASSRRRSSICSICWSTADAGYPPHPPPHPPHLPLPRPPYPLPPFAQAAARLRGLVGNAGSAWDSGGAGAGGARSYAWGEYGSAQRRALRN